MQKTPGSQEHRGFLFYLRPMEEKTAFRSLTQGFDVA